MKLINYYQNLLTEYNQRSMKDRKWLVKVKYCQSKINKLYLQKHCGIKKRLKLEKCGLTETANLAQVCIDKQKYNQRFINEFQNDENIIFRGNEVYEAITNQYKKFFSDNEPIKDFDILKAFNLESMNTLDEHERKDLIQPFTSEEIQIALTQLNLSASTGWDGLGAKWAVRYKERVVADMVKLFNSFWDLPLVVGDFFTSIGILLKKKSKQIPSSNNLRLIHMQNIDSKLFLKCIANRIRSVLLYILH